MQRCLLTFLVALTALSGLWAQTGQAPQVPATDGMRWQAWSDLHFPSFPFSIERFQTAGPPFPPFLSDNTAESYDPFAGAASFTLHLDQISSKAWCYPLPGAHVISPFGGRDGRAHTGTDIKTFAGDSVRAAFSGLVTMAEPYGAYGNCVVLRHAGGIETLYSHNSRNLVSVGQYVRPGQVIALTGRTGRATTEHVHFEFRVGQHRINSNYIFDHDSLCLKKQSVVIHRNGRVQAAASHSK